MALCQSLLLIMTVPDLRKNCLHLAGLRELQSLCYLQGSAAQRDRLKSRFTALRQLQRRKGGILYRICLRPSQIWLILKRAQTGCVVKHSVASSYGWHAETYRGLRLLDASYSYKNDYNAPASRRRTKPMRCR
jgi:hypothetical protein